MRSFVLVVALLVATRDVEADDQRTTAVTAQSKPKSTRTKWIVGGSIAAFHAAFLIWQSLAWDRKGNGDFTFEGPYSPFAVDEFAGGLDKFGHTWGPYALTRGTTAALVAADWPRLPSSIASFGLTEAAYLLIEIQDGFAPYGFGKKDLVANILGGSLGVLMDNVPAVDRLFDFRLEYWPSPRYRQQFRETHDLDGAQDYTGQSYILALHLGAVLPDRDWSYWARFVDVAVGFEAKHYYPQPDDLMPRQTLYGGLAINMQGVLSHLFAPSTGRTIGRGIFEAYALPYTTFRFAEASRSP